MYQPVSYRLQGRMGSRDDLRNLIYTCRQLGVRLYADAVINHMTGGGNDMNIDHRNPNAGCTHWPNKTSSLELYNNLTGSSPFYNQDFTYQCSNVTGYPSSQEYPGAAYGPLDVNYLIIYIYSICIPFGYIIENVLTILKKNSFIVKDH